MRCYTRDELRSYVLGNLSEEILCQISDHLDSCDVCEDTIVGMDQTSDSLMESLKVVQPNNAGRMSPYEKNPDFELAVAASHQLLHRQDSNTEPSLEPTRIGDYEIISTIGRGGMGSVFKARHTRLGKQVAVKILPFRKMRAPDSVARFNREMKIIGQMDHPGIVTAFDAGEEQGTHYLVMELVEGIDLGLLTRLCGPLEVADACELVRQSAIGIQYAHEQDVVHRDVKPSNLMLTSDEKMKVLDLGLATLGSLDGTVDELTTVGQLMGTLDYMAPEQLGSDTITFSSDIYSLSATLYKLLTGSAPYSNSENDTPLKKLRSMACSKPTPIRDRCDSIPVELAKLIDRGLSTDPAARFESATDFANQLEPFGREANLKKLLERAASLKQSKVVAAASRPVELEPKSWHSKASPPVKQTSASVPKLQSGRKWPRIERLISMMAIFGLLTLGGIVIYVQTSTGQVVIESEVDDVKVVLLKNDQPSKELVVEHDSKSTRLFAGEYKVLIEGESDSMVVENGDFKIKRGGVVVVRIREKPIAIAGTMKPVVRAPLFIAPEYKWESDGFTLTVLAPKTPQPTGEQVEYRITISNTAKKKPMKIENLAMQFSKGIEPNDASGNATFASGQVFFPTQVIELGETKNFTVNAIANEPGIHTYRVVSQIAGSESDPLEGKTEFFIGKEFFAASEPIREAPDKAVASKPLPTYDGGTLERWLEVAINDPSSGAWNEQIKALAKRTPVAAQKQYVRTMIEDSKLEFSFKRQQRLFETLSLMAADDKIADMLVDRVESLILENSQMNAASFCTLIYRMNRDVVKLRFKEMIESKNSKLQEAAIVGAAILRNESPSFRREFQFGKKWLPPLLAFSNDENTTCRGEAISLSIEVFPNQPDVIERELEAVKQSTEVSYNRIQSLIVAGCNDDSIHSAFIRLAKDLYKSHSQQNTPEVLWKTALQHRFTRNEKSKLLDAVLESFDDPHWGMERSPAINEEQLQSLHSIAEHRGYSRVRWNEPANFRQAMIRKIFVPQFAPEVEQSTKPQTGNIPYNYYTSYQVSKHFHSDDVDKLREQLLDFAYKQLELNSKTDADLVRSQLFTEIDAAICRLKSLKLETTRLKSNYCEHLRLPIYHGNNLEHWINAAKAAKTDAELLAAVNGVVALQLQSKNPSQLLFDTIPLFRKVSFDDVIDVSISDESRLAAAAVSLAQPEILFTYPTGKGTKQGKFEFPLRNTLLENLNDFDDRDAACLQAIIHRNALHKDEEFQSQLVQFAKSLIDSDDADVRRRAILSILRLSLAISPRQGVPGAPTGFPWFVEQAIESLDPAESLAFIVRTPFPNRFPFSPGPTPAVHQFLIERNQPEQVARLLGLMEWFEFDQRKLSNKQIRAQVNNMDSTSFDWMLVSILAKDYDWLDEPSAQEEYSLWKGTVLSSNSAKFVNRSLFERMIRLLDRAKCSIPAMESCKDDKQKAIVASAIETLEKRAKTAKGATKRILQRILEESSQK